MASVIPFGYSNGGVQEIERLMSLPDTFLVDIRYSPHSNWQAFNHPALQARFGKRYVHLRELGNVNYRSDQPIKLASPTVGIARLTKGLEQGRTLILMCGCREYETCHRKVVVDMLREKMPDAQIVLPDCAAPTDTMKCLSIQQPWTWLIASGYKDIENHNWNTSYRGPVLIHAGAKFDTSWFTPSGQLIHDHPMRDLIPTDMPPMTNYYIKSIVAIADLVDVVKQSDSPWFIGPYGFVFENAHMFGNPIPYSGQLKLFDVSREIIPEWEGRNA
jgi:ASCH domain